MSQDYLEGEGTEAERTLSFMDDFATLLFSVAVLDVLSFC